MTGPGMIVLPNGGEIRVEYIEREIPTTDSNTALFKVSSMKWPIIIRSRKIGDRMSIKGMQGSKKLKSIFIDQKVPVQERNMWPVLTDKEGSIIWLPGLKKSSFEGIDYCSKNIYYSHIKSSDLLGGTIRMKQDIEKVLVTEERFKPKSGAGSTVNGRVSG